MIFLPILVFSQNAFQDALQLNRKVLEKKVTTFKTKRLRMRRVVWIPKASSSATYLVLKLTVCMSISLTTLW